MVVRVDIGLFTCLMMKFPSGDQSGSFVARNGGGGVSLSHAPPAPPHDALMSLRRGLEGGQVWTRRRRLRLAVCLRAARGRERGKGLIASESRMRAANRLSGLAARTDWGCSSVFLLARCSRPANYSSATGLRLLLC